MVREEGYNDESGEGNTKIFKGIQRAGEEDCEGQRDKNIHDGGREEKIAWGEEEQQIRQNE